MQLDAKVPGGPLAEKWDRHRFELKLVNPANKRKYNIIVVGTGLAGSSASATLAELGYNIKAFCIQDSPRRAHSIAAQHLHDVQSRIAKLRRLERELKRITKCDAGNVAACAVIEALADHELCETEH